MNCILACQKNARCTFVTHNILKNPNLWLKGQGFTYQVLEEKEPDGYVVYDCHDADCQRVLWGYARVVCLELRKRAEDEGHRRYQNHSKRRECHNLKRTRICQKSFKQFKI